jgi:hypothetical protein
MLWVLPELLLLLLLLLPTLKSRQAYQKREKGWMQPRVTRVAAPLAFDLALSVLTGQTCASKTLFFSGQ